MTSPENKVSQNLQAIAAEIEDRLQEVAGQRMLFSLVVFNTTPGTRMNYISNGDRDDVATALRNLLESWDQGMPDVPAHKVT